MKRQVEVIATPIDVHQVIHSLMNSKGTCTCGRVLSSIDAKFILINALPSQSKMIIAAYCFNCANHINHAIKLCRSVIQPTVYTEPVDRPRG